MRTAENKNGCTVLQAEIRRLLTELEQLKDKTARCGHTQFAARLSAMSQAARQVISPVAATEVIDPSTIVSASNKDDNDRFENGPSTDHRRKEANVESTLKKRVHSVKERNKSPKHSPDSGKFQVQSNHNVFISSRLSFGVNVNVIQMAAQDWEV